ncbi:uncharacterized protein LOC115665519 isoform X2 [Syzygium oleosum]|uniref:uncharacterized protein LOC115665519 isoform X2 n=1 Tax=Syzygium oleosum TaxID=219896 RepID=UPI0024BBC099|nr:uncharacterized protein LOC115665519 isoform X2 [Syzygium oleosum]
MMSDGSSSAVRLVRCPRCGNLSPEPSDNSVYRCGACGAFLRAKRKNALAANSIFSSADTITVGASDTKRDGDTLKAVEGGNETVVSGASDLDVNSNSSSGTQKEDDFSVGERNGDEGMELKVDWSEAVVEAGHGIESGQPLTIDLNRPKSIDSSMEGGLRENPANLTRYSSRPSSRVDADQWYMTGECFEGIPGNSSDVVGTSRIPSHEYVSDGSSNHQPRSYFEHGKSVKSNVHINGLDRGDSLDVDAELLRKLDDLKHHISRISNAPERTGETAFLNREGLPEPFGDRFRYVSGGLLTPGKPVLVPPHLIHHREQHPSIDRDTHDFYLPPIPRSVTTSRPHHQYVKQSYRGHLNKYMDLTRDFSASDSQDSSLDRNLCTCFHCRHEHEQAPQSVQPTPFGPKGSVGYPVNFTSYHHRDPIQIWPRGHLGVHIPPLSSHNPRAQRRWPTESIVSDTDTAGSQQKIIAISDRSKKHYHPISGGAPFITCCKCSELLILPSNISVERRKKPNLQCWSCSTVLLVEVLGRRLVTSVTRQSSYLDNNGSHEAVKEKIASLQRGLGVKGIDSSGDGSAIDICSPGHGNSSFPKKYEANEESDDRQVNMQNYEHGSSLAPSSHSSEEEDVPNEVKLGTDLSTSAENPLLREESPTVPSLTFNKNLDNSSSKISEDQYAEASEIKEIHRDFLVQKGVPRQKPVQDTATEDEIEYSLNDYLNTSQDSSDASKEADRSKTKKRDKFFFVSLIKKSIRDFSRSNEIVEIEKPNVVINGHPIPNHLVKKAEKLAGPIRPGNYWYDVQGGFWGVMGRTCSGIIPPFIEEFNYPMPANCAAGNTGVFVNGRELHQKDLELLASRGLPTAPNRFYKVEISGRVWDEKSGKKLCRLGKLAPTVQRAKRGFGMRESRQ